jgi:hypothetical protein
MIVTAKRPIGIIATLAALALGLTALLCSTAAAAPVEEQSPLLVHAEEQAVQAEEAAEQAEEHAEVLEASTYSRVEQKAEAEFPGQARRIARIHSLIAQKIAKKAELRALPLHSKRRKVFLPQRRAALMALRRHLSSVKKALRARYLAAQA